MVISNPLGVFTQLSVVFGTSGIRGEFGSTITAELALDIGRALAVDGADCVVVGRDPRLTGELLADACATGLRECGADVVDIGVAATPTIARSVGWRDADAGVAITASHNPPTDNGIKLWAPSGMAFDESRRERVATLVEADAFTPVEWDETGARRAWDRATERHVEAVTEAIDADVIAEAAPSVVVDVGNGAGGATVAALRALGCHVETLNEVPDGRFPARPSEPTAENCGTLRAVVANTDADLGVAHDGDADRMLAVTASGTFVSGDVLLAIFALEAVRAVEGGDTANGAEAGDDDRTAGDGPAVAAPLNTSLAVEDALAEAGASLRRTRVGDVYVAERTRADGCVFGGEPSGAWIWPEETLCPDGTLAACRLVEAVARRGPLSSLADAVDSYPIRRGSVEIADDAKAAVMERVRARIESEYDDPTTLDGVRVDSDDGWFLIRASGTQPLVRVTAESRADSRAAALFERARSFVEAAR